MNNYLHRKTGLALIIAWCWFCLYIFYMLNIFAGMTSETLFWLTPIIFMGYSIPITGNNNFAFFSKISTMILHWIICIDVFLTNQVITQIFFNSLLVLFLCVLYHFVSIPEQENV